MTTPVRIKRLLKDHLDGLRECELRTFQWYLVNNEIEGCRPIPPAQLEGATTVQTVDKLVQVYGEEGAVEATLDIFIAMRFFNLESQLRRAIDPPVEQPPASAARETNRDLDSTSIDDSSCPICQCIFTDPVVLPCGHSFCKACIHRSWQGKISRKCPLCLQVHRVRNPPINFALKSLIEAYIARNQVDPSGGHRSDLESHQMTLKEKQEDFENIRQFCESSVDQIKIQSHTTEENIKKDFQEFRHFLEREEEARLTVLKKEETEKIQMMQKITEMSRVTFSLCDIVKDVEDLKPDNSSIKTFKTEMRKAQGALPDPRGLPEILIDVPKHVENLQVQVWRKMRNIIKHVAPVDMDLNSASPQPSVSDDVTMPSVTHTRQKNPENPKPASSQPRQDVQNKDDENDDQEQTDHTFKFSDLLRHKDMILY